MRLLPSTKMVSVLSCIAPIPGVLGYDLSLFRVIARCTQVEVQVWQKSS